MSARPQRPARLRFVDRALDARTGTLRLSWQLAHEQGEQTLFEHFELGQPAVDPDQPARARALNAALDLLHWIAGISYWKLACCGAVAFEHARPSPETAALLTALYRDGLAELAFVNRLSAPWWPDFLAAPSSESKPAAALGLAPRTLLPLGGGKDSLVALERLRATGVEPITVQVGSAALIAEVAAVAGTEHRRIERRLDPALAALNRAGAINGHVPITAINAAVLLVAALWWDCNQVVFANERSASVPTMHTVGGVAVNHQWSKGWAFEQAFEQCVQHEVAADLAVYSLLRRDSELAACAEFARLDRYHAVFSSCNRNFHLDGPRTERWCRQCPKCRFVFLGLAPFLSPTRLTDIFGEDLLADPAQVEGFAALLELDGPRPFECVGEAGESRSALAALAADPVWREHAVVRALAEPVAALAPRPLAAWQVASGPHGIPPPPPCV
ncbi:MAG: hypothetical protein RQ729_07360 [Wenzhouxiangellaceae bacterium]|nr:hypothetical protein [Wenzhouxiangellaceae bacterium]